MTPSKDSVTLVIIAHHQEGVLEQVLADWHDQLKNDQIEHQFVVGFTSSSELQQSRIRKLNSKFPNLTTFNYETKHYGAAVKMGYISSLESSSNFIFHTDCSQSYSPNDFKLLWCRRKESPALFGARRNRVDNFKNRVASFLLRNFIFKYFEVSIPDANTSYSLYEKTFFQNLIKAIPIGTIHPNIFLSILSYKYLRRPISVEINQIKSTQRAQATNLKAALETYFGLIHLTYTLKGKLFFINEKFKRDALEAVNGKAQSSYENSRIAA